MGNKSADWALTAPMKSRQPDGICLASAEWKRKEAVLVAFKIM